MFDSELRVQYVQCIEDLCSSEHSSSILKVLISSQLNYNMERLAKQVEKYNSVVVMKTIKRMKVKSVLSILNTIDIALRKSMNSSTYSF